MEKNYSATFLKDTIVAGCIIGLAVFAIHLLSASMQWELNGHSSWKSWPSFLIIVAGAGFFGYKRSMLAGRLGFNYGQSLGFIVVSMVFAGVIVGLGDLILNKVIFPEYFANLLDVSMEQVEDSIASNPFTSGDPAAAEQSMKIGAMIAKNPFLIFIGGVFNMVFTGTFAGLFLSIFLKRKADPFYEQPMQ